MDTIQQIDPTDAHARYSVAGFGGIAFYLTGWATEYIYEGDYLACDDEDCDHQLSEMCWTEGDTSLAQSDTQVIGVMVGDDRTHVLNLDDLTLIAEDDYCGGCGQIGCNHG